MNLSEFETNGFNKVVNYNKKILIHLFNTKTNINKEFNFNFETNLIYSIPETNIKFAIACINNDDNNTLFFVNNVIYGIYEGDSSANRTFYNGLTDKYQFYSYSFYESQIIKIHLQDNYYMDISIINSNNDINNNKNDDMQNKELLRVECATNGVTFILPPKRTFVFYNDRLEIYNKNSLTRTIKYNEIIEIQIMKTWQNNVFINCKPIGVMLYKVSNDICSKIKEITGK